MPIPARQNSSAKQYFIYVLLISIFLVAPCFWQSRIQAGDLSSHIYNAWLTLQVERGTISGLHVVHPSTNIALDLLFTWLLPRTHAGMAQHLVVPFFVLVFCWGAFAFICAVANRTSWPMMLCVALLGYGFIFHLGLLNFYFSTGLCFAFLGLTWNSASQKILLAFPLLIMAWLGHPLPILWTAGALAYRKLAARVPARFLFPGLLLAILVLRLVMMRIYPAVWSPTQISMSTGADQVFLYGKRYVIVMVALLLAWAGMLRRLAHENGWRHLAFQIPAQLWILTAFALTILPRSIFFNPHGAPVTFLPERMSLFCGILVCALAAKATMRLPTKAILAFTGLLFFVFSYQDDRRLNRLEDRVSASVAGLSFPQRVVFVPEDQFSRLPPPAHMIDRACIQHCLSYGNYEPGSGHFRLRSDSENPAVLSSYWDLQRLAQGSYIVQPRDMPLYQSVPLTGTEAYSTIQLSSGQRIASAAVPD